MAKSKAKYRPMHWRKNDPTHNLYKAVRDYVRAHKGGVVVMGGVQIQEWPSDPSFTYHVAVRCTGKKPEFRKAESD